MTKRGRAYFRDRQAVQTGITTITGKLTVGASGAVTAFDMPGVSTFVRTSQGKYTLTLDNSYREFIGCDFTVLDTASAGIFLFQINAETVSATTPTVIIDCLDAAGAIQDPADGALIYIHLQVRTTTAGV
jgi:hypothetical protein